MKLPTNELTNVHVETDALIRRFRAATCLKHLLHLLLGQNCTLIVNCHQELLGKQIVIDFQLDC